MSFVHLHCHSPYSFLDGASPIDSLVEEAARLGMPAIALTDHMNVAGAVAWQKRVQAAGLRPIQGAELTLTGGAHLTVLARGPAGYADLCRLLTRAHLAGERRAPAVTPAMLAEAAAGGELLALSGCRRGEVPTLVLQGRLAEAEAAARRYARLFGRGGFWLELPSGDLPGDRGLSRALRDLAAHLGLGVVATANVHYRCPDDFFVHDLLTCARTLTRLDEVHPERRLNAGNDLKSPAEMAERFADCPEAIAGTLALAETCRPCLDMSARRFPSFAVPGGASAAAYLREATYAGARRRYGRLSRTVRDRLEHELGIIIHLGYEDYFLLVWDVCRFAREQGIRCAGRGSAADSAVAYCLGITDVDAVGRGLLFERFMSVERAEQPDIDIDFDSRRRDAVAEYVYAKYGRERVAAVCTYNTFGARSAVRDLGKAMGLPPEALDALAKRLPYFGQADDIRRLSRVLPELRRSDIPFHKLTTLLDACERVARLPRYLGTHLGGLVVSRDPLTAIVPLQRSAKGGVVCQFDKEYVEDLGLVKLDLLSLRTLGAVDDTLKELARERITVDYEALRLDDPEVYAMIGRGETVGVFQLESPAQRALQTRLQADRFEDIVASVAIIRPGPIKGNMVEPFIARRQGRAPVTYLHPALEPILAKTYGVVLFQEQVIEIATAVAGFTPGEADRLRRVMTHARNRQDMQEIGLQFVAKAVARGVERGVAEVIFSHIAGYASYGFCEAHAAAFAGTAYKTAYLLRHHPAEYFAALLSNQPMGYYPPNTLCVEARRRGVTVLPLDINESRTAWRVAALPGGGRGIRVGFGQLKGMPAATLAALAAAGAEGSFATLAETCARLAAADTAALRRDVIENLVLAGAFDSLHPNRRALLWQVPTALAAARQPTARQPTARQSAAQTAAAPLPQVVDFSENEKFLAEYRLLGVMQGAHYMQRQREHLRRHGFITAQELRDRPHGAAVRVAGLVIQPHRPPTRSGRVVTFLSLEDETGLADVTIFAAAYERYGHLIFTDPRPPLAVAGRLERRGGALSVVAERLKALV